MKKLHNRGDTLIEVMIVLAVLGLALSIAYATANRSLLNARQAQEYAEASALVQSQIEKLRANSAYESSSNKYIYLPSSDRFCILDDNTVVTSTNTGCKQGLYSLQIMHKTDGTFVVQAQWEDVTGDDTNTLAMSYRLYPQ